MCFLSNMSGDQQSVKQSSLFITEAAGSFWIAHAMSLPVIKSPVIGCGRLLLLMLAVMNGCEFTQVAAGMECRLIHWGGVTWNWQDSRGYHSTASIHNRLSIQCLAHWIIIFFLLRYSRDVMKIAERGLECLEGRHTQLFSEECESLHAPKYRNLHPNFRKKQQCSKQRMSPL